MHNTPTVTEQLALDHGLTVDEYGRILRALGRTPTFEELGVFSVMWSEHCSYKSSRRFLRQFPTKTVPGGPEILQGPGENAGIVAVDDDLAVVFKIESHNHPSFIEPYHGAATGVGGIIRDVFTMGARPIASLNSLRFGAIDHPRTPYLVKGVVAGIGGYGNCVGVATVGGEVYFDAGYNGNILVNAFTLGTIRTDRIFRASAAGVGNPVMYVGSRTGRDGIHGASLLASREFDAKSEDLRPAVQVGDPFTEKLLIEACLELMQRDLIVAIQDMGAAGLTSSSVEMAGRGGTGLSLNLNKIPTREDNISPYELLLSESQERMLIVAKAGCEHDVQAIFARWDLQAEVVGHVTDDGLFRAQWHGEEVIRIPIPALTDDAPVYERPAQQPADFVARQQLDISALPLPGDYGQVLTRLLTSPNLASKEWVFRQYDSFVCGNTVVQPGSDAAIIRLKGTDKGIGLSVDCNSRYCLLDPYRGGMIAVVEGARNLAVSGARPVALSDCLNFGSPEKPEVMWQFQQAIAGMRDACLALGLAVVSGNVSFYNETEGKPIPPTPTVASVGILADVTHHVTQWFKQEGDLIVLLGDTQPTLGASEYLAVVHGLVAGAPPEVNLEQEKRLQQLCLTAAERQVFSSAHDVAEGGLAVALAEACLSRPEGALGARVTLNGNLRPDVLLFGESQSRVVVSLPTSSLPLLRTLAQEAHIPYTVLGEVGGPDLIINGHLQLQITHLCHQWRTALSQQITGVRTSTDQ
ncbi:MAG: phosphoribosylformylglycinamidine synthase subunit PurL [Deltaproteobacteria bacterium]|nr:phosphoribosylformylglycinamidine synthase subunit PurL [Deltaproteobacteria bacterium]